MEVRLINKNGIAAGLTTVNITQDSPYIAIDKEREIES